MAYPLGTEVGITGSFQNLAGADTDPSTVTLYVQQPGQVGSTQYTWPIGQLVRNGTGIFTLDLLLDVPGTWTYCWESTGVVEAATFDIPMQVSPSKLRTT